MSTPENLPQVFMNDSIDVITLLKRIYQGRKVILYSTFIFMVLGLIISISQPDNYTSQTIFVPQVSGNSKSTSGLSGLASLAGINLNSTSTGSEIPPSIYPQIISSFPFRMDLLKETFVINDTTLSLREYLIENSQISWISSILQNRVNSNHLFIKNNEQDISQISLEDLKLFKIFDEKLKLTLNEKGGFVTLSYSDGNKFVSAYVTQKAKELLQDRLIDYRISSAQEVFNFTENQYKINKDLYNELQDSIAVFKDQNLNISSSLFQNRLSRLERDLEISSSVVEQLASQLEQARLEVNKNTPVFTVIHPVTIPLFKSSPDRLYLIFIWIFLGFFISSSYTILKPSVFKLIRILSS